MQIKIDLVKQFSKHARVYITSEKPLPPELDRHRLSMPPNYIHHLLAFATLLYGESATMASECAVLGTPAIYIDNVGRGYTDEQEHVFGSVFNFRETPDDIQASIRKGLDILTTPDIKAQWRDKSAALIKQKIDVTDWMVDFVKKAVP
jgi:predicted glycosyltransferase